MRNSRLLPWFGGFLGVLFLVGGCVFLAAWWRPAPEETLKSARAALAHGDFRRAELLAIRAAQFPHADPWAWMVAGEAAARDQRFAAALQHYQHVAHGGSDLLSAAAHGRGEMCLQLGNWQRAEAEYARALEIDSHNITAQRRLADLYNLTGRRHRAVPLMEQLIGTPAGTLEDLFYLGDVDHGIQLPDAIRARQDAAALDPLIQLALGNEALAENRNEDALRFCKLAFQRRGDDADTVAAIGQALLHLESSEFSDWRHDLSRSSMVDAGVLAVLGQGAEREQRYADAVSMFARAVAKRPTSRIAWHRLGLSLSRVGKTKAATLALQRARMLQHLALWLDDLHQHREQMQLVRRIALQLASVGRTAEAAAWTQYALQQAPRTEWAVTLRTKLEQDPDGLIDTEQERALTLLLNDLIDGLSTPSPSDGITAEIARTPNPTLSTGSSVRFTFVDEAHPTGLSFVHHSARDPATPGARILETTGGGVGVVDYDEDGWPDVYFPQGSKTFPVPGDNSDCDRLFRNRLGQSWVDISQSAHVFDADFSQGIAAGDFDNDGFADLYVANYGGNRLLRNQGDGTFLDVTPDAMRMKPVWTTSCVIVDLNDDGAPDLFDVTYCGGADVETRICEQHGQPRSCSPRAFIAERDRVWWNSGDGDWILGSHDGLDLPDGLGLGIVAFRPTPDLPLSLFVANDEAPNFWLNRSSVDSGSETHWQDRALVGGLAVDADGKPQACMGIACDDIDGNGLLDVFVTNFYQESNTLYAAATAEFFEDVTRRSGLREPSWNQLGFGAQFLDVDRDSWPDLLVANGHIDDLTAAGQPYEMPIQLFRNVVGRFVEQRNAAELAPAVGRGMARLDWNCDGREDVIIANQEAPARLLTNQTESVHRSLTLSFRAISTARDAIGTIVRVQIGPRILTRQLTAGDGYMASNERQLVIGVGAADTVDALEVFWPSGVYEQFESVKAEERYLLIEGKAPLLLPSTPTVASATSSR